MDNYITIAASFASILGAIIAIWQSCRAKKFATIASDAKREVLSKKKALDFNSLLHKAREIELILIAQTSKSATQQRGRNTSKEHSEIESFISMLNEKKSISMSIELKSFLDEKYRKITICNNASQKPINDMLSCVRDIISKVSEEINKNTYE
ncbi:hypothetical protein [Dysgonomonas reticulitermitis]